MDIFFPPQTLSLFQVFAPYFTVPSFAYFQRSMWALMVVEGRKCMPRLAGCVFFHQRGLSSWERFLAEHRWSVTAVTARLVRLVVERLGEQLKVHGASLLGKDTTLVAKSAKRMVGVQKWKDHSDNADRGTYMVGHHWNLVGLISPWGTWEWIGPAALGAVLPARGTVELGFDVTPPAWVEPGQWWALIRIGCAGRLVYTPSVNVTVQ